MERLLLRMIGQEEVGQRIRQARDDADLTQAELATEIGLQDAQSISRYERGEVEVPAKRLRRIAERTGKPMTFFVQEVADITAREESSELGLVERLEAVADVFAHGVQHLETVVERLEQVARGEPKHG